MFTLLTDTQMQDFPYPILNAVPEDAWYAAEDDVLREAMVAANVESCSPGARRPCGTFYITPLYTAGWDSLLWWLIERVDAE